ncbi:MAG: hypothetical protein C4570_00265 [Ammonifex sp.]|jgi:hypothetical protein|nr:MAG: hypothetical protein C4570_00265 [Ammonifex sp.]
MWYPGIPGMNIGKEPTIQDLLKQISQLNDQIMIYQRDQAYRQDVAGMKRAWQERGEDNVKSGNPLVLDVYIPPDTKLVNRAYLRIRLKNFRSYGSSASGGGGLIMTSESEDTQHKHIAGDVQTSGPWGWDDPPTHTHAVPLYNTGYQLVSHAHNVTLPDHIHGIVHDIYEGTAASNVTVTINGVDRTVALGGPFNTNQDRLDITKYLTTTGWNTIEIGSGSLGRIHATLFTEIYLP